MRSLLLRKPTQAYKKSTATELHQKQPHVHSVPKYKTTHINQSLNLTCTDPYPFTH